MLKLISIVYQYKIETTTALTTVKQDTHTMSYEAIPSDQSMVIDFHLEPLAISENSAKFLKTDNPFSQNGFFQRPSKGLVSGVFPLLF